MATRERSRNPGMALRSGSEPLAGKAFDVEDEQLRYIENGMWSPTVACQENPIPPRISSRYFSGHS